MRVLTVGNSDGERHCDERCYNAKPGGKCTCCCGGANHGKGLAHAVDRNRQMLEDAADAGVPGAAELREAVLPLFPLSPFRRPEANEAQQPPSKVEP